MAQQHSGVRLSDAEREAAVARLGEHYAVGRLDKDEFDERSDAVWSAKTRGQLAPLFADLPGSAAQPAHQRLNHRPGWHPGLPFPIGAVLALLIVITVLTHLPFILLGLALWFVVGNRRVLRRRWR